MRNIKVYEDHINPFDKPLKNYGEKYPLDKLISGQNIIYSGMPCEVIEAGPYVIYVKSNKFNDKGFRINQAMFNERGFISK